jgi:hypothetical protein
MSPTLAALIVGFLVGLAFGVCLVRREPDAPPRVHHRVRAPTLRIHARKP